MGARLAKDEFLPYAPEKKGRVRINHNGGHCSGASESLLITRNEDGDVSAFCFRCGAAGFYSPGYRHYVSREGSEGRTEPIGDPGTGIVLPPDTRKGVGSFPAEVRSWLSKSGLTAETLDDYGVSWSDAKDWLYIPVRQEVSAFGPVDRGFVQRGFNPKRYLTLSKDKEHFWGFLRGPGPSDTVVLVEDVLSGLRVREIADTMILLGTELRASALSFLLKERFKRALIFLDADNPTVKMKARKIAKKLSWMKVKIVETGKDPKYYTKEQLEELIYEDAKGT